MSLASVPQNCSAENEMRIMHRSFPSIFLSSLSPRLSFLHSSNPAHTSLVTDAYDTVLSPMCCNRPMKKTDKRKPIAPLDFVVPPIADRYTEVDEELLLSSTFLLLSAAVLALMIRSASFIFSPSMTPSQSIGCTRK